MEHLIALGRERYAVLWEPAYLFVSVGIRVGFAATSHAWRRCCAQSPPAACRRTVRTGLWLSVEPRTITCS